MHRSHRQPVSLLTSPLFILGLILLIINDMFLKEEFHNFFTGKLSDLAGLFVFPFFWAVFFDKHRTLIYVATAMLFLFWKLPLSTNLLEGMNGLLGTAFYRVVDYSDFVALGVIPASYQYFNYRSGLNITKETTYSHLSVAVAVLALFSFVATSPPFRVVNDHHLPIHLTYTVERSKEELFKNMFVLYGEYNFQENLSDTVYIVYVPYQSTTLRINTKIYSVSDRQTAFEFIDVDSYTVPRRKTDSLKTRTVVDKIDFRSLIEDVVIAPLSQPVAPRTRLAVDNPRLAAIMHERYRMKMDSVR